MVELSTGNKTFVAPYSGAMLEIVALSPTVKFSTPSPKNSIKLPTTLFALKSFVICKTRSVDVIPSFKLLFKFTPTTSGTVIGIVFPNIEISASTPPTPQPSTPIAFTIGVWLSVPMQVSG